LSPPDGVLERARGSEHLASAASEAGVELHDGDLLSFGGVEMIFKERP